jgi:hypothetical protein
MTIKEISEPEHLSLILFALVPPSRILTNCVNFFKSLHSHSEAAATKSQLSNAQTLNNMMAEHEIDGRKPFVFDAPQSRLMRLFWLDQNGDESPLSGKLYSYRTYHSWDLNNVPKMVYNFNEDIERYRILERVSGTNGYVALSYSWGNTGRHPLYVTTIDGKLDRSKERQDLPGDQRVIMDQDTSRNGYLWIGTNLRDFLLEYRRKGERKFLWIDAICINQSSVEDIDNQIPTMRYYYENAKIVTIWLGTATAMEKGALRILTSLAEKLCKGVQHEGGNFRAIQKSQETGNREMSRVNTDQSYETILQRLDLPPADHEVWGALASILSRSWWSRLWTLQEAAVAGAEKRGDGEADEDVLGRPTIQVMLGEVAIPYETFDNLARGLFKHGLRDWLMAKSGLPINRQLYGLDALREIRLCRESFDDRVWAMSPGVALAATRRREATVPADFVHGMQAMFDPFTIKKMDLSVRMATDEVFIRFAKYYIRNEIHECLLNHLATRDRLQGLPSWCPHFASPEETIPIGSRMFAYNQLSKAQKGQIPHAGHAVEDAEDYPFMKWAMPISKSWVLKMAWNTIKGKDLFGGTYDTSNPRQISLVKGTNFIQASGVALDTVVDFVDCNPAMDLEDTGSKEAIQQTLEWDQRCLNLATKSLPRKTEDEILNIHARTITTNRVTMDVYEEDQLTFDWQHSLDFAGAYHDWKMYLQTALTTTNEPSRKPQSSKSRDGIQFANVYTSMSRRRRLFVTKDGKVGFGPSNLQIGDQLVVIFFCPTPYLIRGKHMTENWEFVGETYVHGLMNGEVLELIDNGSIKETKWVIE